MGQVWLVDGLRGLERAARYNGLEGVVTEASLKAHTHKL